MEKNLISFRSILYTTVEMMDWAKQAVYSSVLWFVGMNILVQNQNILLLHAQATTFHGAGEKNQGYALLMVANKP